MPNKSNRTSFTKNVVLIGLSISIFIAIIMGFIIGSLVEDLSFKNLQENIGLLITDEINSSYTQGGLGADMLYGNLFDRLNGKNQFIVGVNIMSKEGAILYSDEPSLVGKEFSDKKKIVQTLYQEPRYFIDRNMISPETVPKERYVHVLVLFYPSSIDNEAYVIQIIYNIQTIEKGINRINLLMWATIVLSIGVVFASVIIISASSHKILERLKNSLELKVHERTAQLERAKINLDKKVEQRTIMLKAATKKSIEEYHELKKLTRDIQKQNQDLIKRTIELNELKGELEDKNIDLNIANKDIKKQNKDLISKTLQLTELKGQIEDKNIDLETANKEILETLQEKTQFINRAAHDLRTPLTPILTLLPIIKDRIKDKKNLYDLSIVENNTMYLSEIVKELILLIKTEAKVDYNFQRLGFKKLVDEVVKNHSIVLEKNNVKISVMMPNNLPKIEGDRNKLIELMQNLISNAAKFMPRGGKITISAGETDNFINVRVSDTGIGMNKKTLSMLFHEFFKADNSRHYQGSGLGLSICKKIVESHGGKMWAESEGIGKGSTIAFNLPISTKR